MPFRFPAKKGSPFFPFVCGITISKSPYTKQKERRIAFLCRFLSRYLIRKRFILIKPSFFFGIMTVLAVHGGLYNATCFQVKCCSIYRVLLAFSNKGSLALD